MENKPPKPRPCSPEKHEPATYAEFESMCENIRSWGWDDDPLAMIGECRKCGSSITHHKPSIPTSGLKHEVVAEMDRIAAEVPG